MVNEITIIKRNGHKAKLDISKIREVIKYATINLDNIDPLELELDAQIQFRNNITTKEIHQILIKTAVDKISSQYPNWSFVAARLMLYDLYKEVGHIRGYKVKDKLTNTYKAYNKDSFYNLIEFGINNNIYNPKLLVKYNKDEITELSNYIKPERDLLFNYVGIKTLMDRYLIKNKNGNILELPQEMYMLIAMTIGFNEKEDNKINFVKNVYDLLSTHKISLATPILLNARRKINQLSSCFVLTVEDDLRNIFDNITRAAMISKFAGGLGIYLGKLRSLGSPIREYNNVGSGVIPVIKLFNDTMIYVDQLGLRKGSASITLDIWHPDILDFLEIKTNSGEERKKAHDIHPAVSIPDIFMKRLINKEPWTLINPYYSKNVKDGKNLEDLYGEEFEEYYLKLEKELPEYAKRQVNSFDIWKRLLTVIFETGEPYIFFRDTANKYNPNKHVGMVYSSNLCHEIIQNMSPTILTKQEFNSDTKDSYIEEFKIGDTVTCNLGAINLGNIENDSDLENRLLYLVRILDNIIDLNYYTDKSIEKTNQLYRAIGIGVANYHYYLVKRNIPFNSEQHLEEADKLFEKIAYYTLKASSILAKERGHYPLFINSRWHKGQFFGFDELPKSKVNLDWHDLYENYVKQYGIRNGYLLAIMPTGNTSLIINATPSIDPIFEKFYKEENNSGIMPQVPPEIDKYYWHYVSAYNIDQEWIIKAASVRQKWIDQSQSLNLFIDPNNIDGYKLSELYINAWKLGLKTIYYCRSKSIIDIEECDSCSI